MKQITVISGKGGTGKTSLTASLARVAGPIVLVDADVDAANLALVFDGTDAPETDFIAGQLAIIDPESCMLCDICVPTCPYGALSATGDVPAVNPIKCEGCRVCSLTCPADAITFKPKRAGTWTIREWANGPLIHASLAPAEDNSGKLVAALRDTAKTIAKERAFETVVIDGPPGIGCPVHAAISGVDYLVVVTEPTMSGDHDLARALDLARHFKMKAGVIINKDGLSPESTMAVERTAADKNVPILGRIPFDPRIPAALAQGRPLIEVEGMEPLVKSLWKKIVEAVS